LADPVFYVDLCRICTAIAAKTADLSAFITAINISMFSGSLIPELCALGVVTIEDFSESVAYQEIFGLGEARGEAKE
jgi:hypothetical protein